jgi:hypothetical protein
MRLTGSNGHALELRVAGYQFPDDQAGWYDSNWLLIEGRVRHPRGDWSFCDPCLLTYEASQLADWLEAVAAGHEEQSWLGFIEPNLSFERAVANGQRVLYICFGLEAHPPWSPPGEEAIIEFALEELDLRQAANEWRDQLRKFPQRAEV